MSGRFFSGTEQVSEGVFELGVFRTCLKMTPRWIVKDIDDCWEKMGSRWGLTFQQQFLLDQRQVEGRDFIGHLQLRFRESTVGRHYCR